MGGINGIDTVPIDYFLHGAGVATKVESQTVEDGTQKASQTGKPSTTTTTTTTTKPPRTAEVVQQLDILLVRAAKTKMRSVDWKGLQPKVDSLIQAGVLTAAEAKEIQKAANAAAATFKSLDAFTGEQLAQAVKVGANGRAGLDAQTKVGLLVVASIKAQTDLSELLSLVGKRLWNATGPAADLADSFMEQRQICDRRATEIQSLAFQMYKFSLQATANGKHTDPNITAILKATTKELLPRQALAMHGTPEALGELNAKFTEKLRPLAERIDAFAKNPSASISSEELESLRADLELMKAAVLDARRTGVESPAGGCVKIPNDILLGLGSVLDYAERALADARRIVVGTMRRNMFDTIEGLFPMSKDRIEETKGKHPETAPLFKTYDDFTEALADYIAKADNSEDSQKTRMALAKAMQLADNLREVSMELTKDGIPESYGEDYGAFAKGARGAHTFMAPFADLSRRVRNADSGLYLSGAEARLLFDGKIGVSSAVEARVRGFRDSDVNPATNEANLVSSRPLESGGAGMTYELNYASGETFVFKGEAESRAGLARLLVGSAGAYAEGQKAINLNIASRTVADHIGCGDLIVKYSAGMFGKTFGFFMEKAPGMSPAQYWDDLDKAPDGGLSANEIHSLPDDERRIARAEVKRQLNRLHWIDLLTGQLDRHHGNYFIHVDRNTHAVTVKGIDNDASFSVVRTGVSKFELNPLRGKAFMSAVEKVAKRLFPKDIRGGMEKLLADSGIEVHRDWSIVIDASKFRLPIQGGFLERGTGAHNAVPPEHIDREFYDSLMEMKKDSPKRTKLLEDLRDRMAADAIAAFEKRLDDAIAYAGKLAEKKDGIVEKDAWGDVEEKPIGSEKLQMANADGEMVDLPKKLCSDAVEALCPSIFTRDFLDAIF